LTPMLKRPDGSYTNWWGTDLYGLKAA